MDAGVEGVPWGGVEDGPRRRGGAPASPTHMSKGAGFHHPLPNSSARTCSIDPASAEPTHETTHDTGSFNSNKRRRPSVAGIQRYGSCLLPTVSKEVMS
jgi:hypothetical protein